jgi:phage-related holin
MVNAIPSGTADTPFSLYSAICFLLAIIKLIQLIDVANDIVNKTAPRKVTSKRAKKIFRSLKNLTVVTLAVACVTLAAAIDLKAAGEEIVLHNEAFTLHNIGGGLYDGCI